MCWLRLLWLFCLLGCMPGEHRGERQLQPGDGPKYAKGFEIRRSSDGDALLLHRPWPGASASMQIDLSGAEAGSVRVPARRVASYSTTHIAAIAALEELHALQGIANGRLVYDAKLRKQLAEGRAQDLGSDRQIDHERLVAMQPDLVFMYGLDQDFSSTMDHLSSLGLTVVPISEYLEEHPLGQAEWIKVFGALFDKEAAATEYFNRVDSTYRALRALTQGLERPRVFCNMPWKEVWYVPGGNSFMATLIRDAGGAYVFDSLQGRGSIPLDLETVLAGCQEADFWINPGNIRSLEVLRGMDARYAIFSAFEQERVFNHSRRLHEAGGNDFFESGTLRPDRILRDLIAIFHPEVLPETPLFYYERLSQE